MASYVANDIEEDSDVKLTSEVEIDYFAVCKEMRENPDDHLGTYIIEEICRMADADIYSATMFLTVEALDTKEYSAVEFYQKCGFQFSDVAQNKYIYNTTFGNQPTTRRMYKIILPLD